MNVRRLITLGLLLALATIGAGANETPVRERLEQDGWTIGFAPDDRTLAEALARQIGHFEERVAAVEATELELGAAVLGTRAAELATTIAQWCALPGRATDFERAFHRAAERATKIRSDFEAALWPRAVELWRRDELWDRFQSGHELPGVGFPDGEQGSLAMHASIRVFASYSDRVIRIEGVAPAAFTFESPQDLETDAAVRAMLGGFDDWMSKFGAPTAVLYPEFVRMVSVLAIADVMDSEIAPDASSRWIVAGLSNWLWRQWILEIAKPRGAARYATLVPQLAVPAAGSERLDLEQWPEAGDESRHIGCALQLFLNMSTRHGSEAIPQLLAEFWKLPKERRTSAELAEAYQTLWNEPLEDRAPWRSLGRVP